MFKGTPRQFIFMNPITEKLLVMGYKTAESWFYTRPSARSNLVYIGEV